MKSFKLLAVVAVFVMSIAGSFAVAESNEKVAENQSPLINQKAPDFSLSGVAGTERSLADFDGKFVVLEWVDFTCPFVRKNYDSKNQQKLQAEFRDQGVAWLSVSSVRPGDNGYLSGKTLRVALAREKSEAADFLIDSAGSAQRAFGVTITPTVVLIGPDRVVRYFGAIDDQTSNAKGAASTNYLKLAFEAEKSNHHPASSGTLAYGCPAPTTSRTER